jgi:hypothetical protein
MSHRSIISIAASAIIGIACVATVSTDALAYRGGRAGVGRVGVHHAGVYRAPVRRGVRAGVAVGVGAAAAGAYGAYRAPGAQCGYYPYGPCY